MSNADTLLSEVAYARLLLYGPAKSKKTWWACRAAELGFRVLLLDSDNGFHIIRNLSPEARARITVVPLADNDKPIAYRFMRLFYRRKPFLWDITARNVVLTVTERTPTDHHYLAVMPEALNAFDVVVADSHTAMVASLVAEYYQKNNVDLDDPPEKAQRGCYAWCGGVVDFWLTQIKSMPCHMMVIGHETVYEKRQGETVEWSRIQLRDTSGPHAGRLAAAFSDILYFEQVGGGVKVNTAAMQGRDGGCRAFPPGRYDWAELTFKLWCENSGMPLPAADTPVQSPGYIFYPAGTTPVIPSSSSAKQNSPVVVAASATATVDVADKPKPTGLDALLRKAK